MTPLSQLATRSGAWLDASHVQAEAELLTGAGEPAELLCLGARGHSVGALTGRGPGSASPSCGLPCL